LAVFWWIEVFYNRRRRLSFCGQLPPFEFERRWISDLRNGEAELGDPRYSRGDMKP
jgi:hypothetical protein